MNAEDSEKRIRSCVSNTVYILKCKKAFLHLRNVSLSKKPQQQQQQQTLVINIK